VKTFVLIGCGVMGRRHANALLKAHERGEIRLAGVFDLCRSGYDSFCAEVGHAAQQIAFYDDWDEMLHKAKPTGFVVATYAPLNQQYVQQITASVPSPVILLEKPISASIAAAKDIQRYARSGCTIAINHQWRFFPAYRKLFEIANSPELGGVVSASFMAGNAGIAMGGTHAVYLFQWIAKSELRTVQAWLSDTAVPNPRGAEFVDRAGSALFKAENGKNLYINYHPEHHHGMVDTWFCKYGHITVDRLSSTLTVSYRKEEYRHLPSTRYGGPFETQYHELDAMDLVASSYHHLSSLLNGGYYVDADEASHIIKLIAGAYISSETGGALFDVKLDPFPLDRNFGWC